MDRAAARALLGQVKSKPANFIGKTDILQLAALIKRCKVFVTPDSAPLHIAAAVRTPIVAMFGPTDSLRHFPQAKAFRIIEKKPSCAPCYSSTCRIRSHICMSSISSDDVLNKIEELLLKAEQ